MPSPTPSLLPVVLAADNFPSSPLTDPYPSHHPTTGERYTPFHLTFADFQAHLPPLGSLRPEVILEMQSDERGPEACPWQFHSVAEGRSSEHTQSVEGEEGEDGELELSVKCVFLAEWVVEGGKEGIGRVMQETVERWRSEGKFSEPLGGWRDEKYSIWTPPQTSAFKVEQNRPFSNLAFALERSACAIFGLATFGVHLTAYEGEGEDMKIWVPRRSKTKPTFPGLLDNSVAGGIPSGMLPIDAVVKECDEEASLPEALIRSRVRSTGVTTYFYITDGGYLQPEIEYIYDLPLPPSDSPEYVRPHPHDDEVESFALLTIPEVFDALHSGEFKPNCGLILVDFLIRHGFITPENEPNYIEISWRSHRRLAVGVPM